MQFDLHAALCIYARTGRQGSIPNDVQTQTKGVKRSKRISGSIDETNFKIMAKKACGSEGKMEGFTVLTPEDVEKIYQMCL